MNRHRKEDFLKQKSQVPVEVLLLISEYATQDLASSVSGPEVVTVK